MLEKYMKILSDSPPQNTFKTTFGEIKNLSGLRDVLKEKGEPFFKDFVTETDNHFANWINEIFLDKELAVSLTKTKSFDETIKLLEGRITYLEMWLDFNLEKELLTNFLVENYPEAAGNGFIPSYHKFETIFDYAADLTDLKMTNNIITDGAARDFVKEPEKINREDATVPAVSNIVEKVNTAENTIIDATVNAAEANSPVMSNAGGKAEDTINHFEEKYPEFKAVAQEPAAQEETPKPKKWFLPSLSFFRKKSE